LGRPAPALAESEIARTDWLANLIYYSFCKLEDLVVTLWHLSPVICILEFVFYGCMGVAVFGLLTLFVEIHKSSLNTSYHNKANRKRR
jgi:hypothetical protein